jgi:hypothetical protein
LMLAVGNPSSGAFPSALLELVSSSPVTLTEKSVDCALPSRILRGGKERSVNLPVPVCAFITIWQAKLPKKCSGKRCQIFCQKTTHHLIVCYQREQHTVRCCLVRCKALFAALLAYKILRYFPPTLACHFLFQTCPESHKIELHAREVAARSVECGVCSRAVRCL